jgi:hypothetical protein
MAVLRAKANSVQERVQVCLGFRSGLLLGVWILFLSPLLLASSGSRPPSRTESSREAQLKAVFLFNFAQFTEWPPEAFADRSSPLIIGLVGLDPFGDSLEATVQDELIHGRRVRVERYRTLAEVKNWHMMYLGQADPERLDQVLQATKGKPILTVSDVQTPALRGGIIIKFLIKQNKIRFVINAEAARQARLVLSSKLLQAADEVIGADKK